MDSNYDILSSIMAPTKSESIIMVLGVGGAGGNAVNHMFDLGIKDVTFMVCNTDKQALANSPVENKVVLGEGLGAGNIPARGRQAAIESLDEIMVHLENCGAKMIFITAGMGGGTGTGAAPVIAKAAKGKGILTVGIVTLPSRIEGRLRMEQALKGLDELRANTDSLVVINNDNITKIYGSIPFEDALHKADDVLATAAKGIAELVTRHGIVNVDFADVSTVMKDSGMALMGSGKATGERKVDEAMEKAISSPLLNHQDILGAKNILLNISYAAGDNLTYEEASRAQEILQTRASRSMGGYDANIIWGAGVNSELNDGEIEVTIVATGFESLGSIESVSSRRRINDLQPKEPTPETDSTVQTTTATEEEQPKEMGVKWDIKEHYGDIDELLKLPAFFRRGMHLDGNISNIKGAKVQVEGQVGEKSREQAQEPIATDGTLFK